MAGINTGDEQKYLGKERRWPCRTGVRLGSAAIAATLFFLWPFASSLEARDGNSTPEPLDPLEEQRPDPLLPKPPKNRPLNLEERQKLEPSLDELNAQAAAQLALGNTKEAFSIWNRELRLRRYLGPLAEVQALNRVGAIAWDNEQITQVQIINQRLEAIQLESCTGNNVRKAGATPPLVCDLTLLQALGTAFEQVRSRDNALTIYQQILADARKREDAPAIEATLKTIGKLNLEKLDYVRAAVPYQELMEQARARGERPLEFDYLQQLAFIYTQGRQRPQAIAVRQRLVEFYVTAQQMKPVPELKLAIASDYQAIGELQEAIQNYNEAYNLGWTLQQFSVASQALQQLGSIYRSLDRLDAALEVYQALLIVDRRAYNLYGIMSSYDKIGQLYKAQRAYPEALGAFQKGLELARQLKYQEAYFTKEIEQIIQKSAQ